MYRLNLSYTDIDSAPQSLDITSILQIDISPSSITGASFWQTEPKRCALVLPLTQLLQELFYEADVPLYGYIPVLCKLYYADIEIIRGYVFPGDVREVYLSRDVADISITITDFAGIAMRRLAGSSKTLTANTSYITLTEALQGIASAAPPDSATNDLSQVSEWTPGFVDNYTLISATNDPQYNIANNPPSGSETVVNDHFLTYYRETEGDDEIDILHSWKYRRNRKFSIVESSSTERTWLGLVWEGVRSVKYKMVGNSLVLISDTNTSILRTKTFIENPIGSEPISPEGLISFGEWLAELSSQYLDGANGIKPVNSGSGTFEIVSADGEVIITRVSASNYNAKYTGATNFTVVIASTSGTISMKEWVSAMMRLLNLTMYSVESDIYIANRTRASGLAVAEPLAGRILAGKSRKRALPSNEKVSLPPQLQNYETMEILLTDYNFFVQSTYYKYEYDFDIALDVYGNSGMTLIQSGLHYSIAGINFLTISASTDYKAGICRIKGWSNA
jgi:hypothetical protein